MSTMTSTVPREFRTESNVQQAPGEAFPPFRFKQGDFDFTILSDGYFTLPGSVFAPEASLAERAEAVEKLGFKDDTIRSRANIPVITRGSEVILVDVGAGQKYEPTEGLLTANMTALGIDPASVSRIVFTHGHPDHIWGTLTETGSLRFPNATYYIGETEWNFWMDPDFRTSMPDVLHPFAIGAQRDLSAVRERLVMLKPGDEVVPGIAALDTAGHTPGHLSFEVAGGEGMIITADAATNHVISFEHPSWRFGYDMLPDVAIRNRALLLDKAATDRVKLLGYHWAYPGVGFAERHGNAYRFAASTN
jgi:glyoxylase-like metal-dependent hydrolase (beta-lactamase superfamily II)